MPINPLQIPGYAAPTPIDFSGFAQLPKIYEDAQNKQTLADLGKGLADGSLNYKQAAGMAAKAGKLDVAMSLIKMGEEKQQQGDFTKNFGQLLGGGGSSSPQTQATPQPTTLGSLGQPQTVDPNQVNSIDAMADLKPQTQAKLPIAQGAVSGIESGGRYDATGPMISSGPMAGQRGIGKYQVMESNVGPWTKEVLGRAMTPQEFAANPDAQDAVFNGKFGGYMEKYGSGGAARAWHAGEGGMNNPAAGDQLGTSTAGYGSRVANAVDGGALPPNARPAGPAQQQPQGYPTPRSNPLQNNIPALMYIMSHPGASAGQKKMAEIALTEAIKSPDNLKEYDFYQRQSLASGQQPLPLLDWTVKIKQAGATAITNDMRGENAESQALGKGAGERANTTIAAAGVASKTLASINRSEALLSGLDQGKIQPARMTIGAWAKSLGVPDGVAEGLGLDPKNVGTAQALQALTAKSVISLIGSGGFPANNFSDADREFLVSTVERLGNDPRANKLILETGRRVAKLDIEKAKEYMAFTRNPTNKGKGYNDFEVSWAEKIANRDQFGDLRKEADSYLGPQAQQQPQPAPPVQGARQAPDGNFYVDDPNRPGKFLQVK